MREILFKGKRIDNGEWVYGNLINWNPKLNPRIIWFEDCEIDEFKETNNEVYKETVSQFTGLLDKNGNKIFEGDVCYHYGKTYIISCEENSGSYIATNLYDKNDQYFIIHLSSDLEVIGDIYENDKN